MKKTKAKPQEEIVQSTLRIPRALWKKINHIAVDKGLSMAQAVLEAIKEYCKREGGNLRCEATDGFTNAVRFLDLLLPARRTVP